MRKFIFIVLALNFSVAAESFAFTMPDEFNPWLIESDVKLAETNDEGENIFFDVMKQYAMMEKSGHSSQARDKFKEQFRIKIREAASKGSFKARLVELAQYSHDDEEVLNSFHSVDQSNDPKLLFEVGKLMQLHYLLCLNVLDENGSFRVERNCMVSNSSSLFDHTYNYKASETLAKKRKERSFGYILKAANIDYPPAQYEIGYLMMKAGDYLPTKAMELEGMHGTQPTDWLKKAAESNNQEAALLLANIQREAQEESDNKAQIAAYEKEHGEIRPKCTQIHFTGIASIGSPQFLEQALMSSDIEDTLAKNPIVCSFKEWDGTYVNGGVINRNRRTECFGVGYFKNKRATIIDWSNTLYSIETEIDFDSGRRPVNLYIQRRNANCITDSE